MTVKILHVVSTLSIDSGVMGVIMNYYRNIDHKKVQFEFLYFIKAEKNHISEIESMGGECHYLKKPSVGTINDYKTFFNNNASKYKAVHLHEIYLNWFIFPMAKKNGIKFLISHSHATKFSDKPISAIRNRILCIPLKKQANIFFACSKAAGYNAYGKKMMESGKVKVVNNAINIGKYKFDDHVRTEIRNRYSLGDKLVIGHVGRFNEQKNHTFIIDIFNELKKREKRAKLLLVGDGPLMENTKSKVIKLGIANDVIFLGRRGDIPELLSAMDIFLLPSLFEGLPVVGVEAQASGLPIVFSETITREIGLFNYKYIDLDDSANIWAKEILNINLTKDRLDACYKVMKSGFDISQEAKKLEKIYLEM